MFRRQNSFSTPEMGSQPLWWGEHSIAVGMGAVGMETPAGMETQISPESSPILTYQWKGQRHNSPEFSFARKVSYYHDSTAPRDSNASAPQDSNATRVSEEFRRDSNASAPQDSNATVSEGFTKFEPLYKQ